MKKILKFLFNISGYKQITQFLENIFRSRFATDMYIAQVQVVSKTHEKTFGDYKNKHQGENIAIVATGPSLNKYKPLSNVINIGVNKAILSEIKNFDYYFIQDYLGIKDYIDELLKYPNIDKFYGVIPRRAYGYKTKDQKGLIIPESTIIKHNAKKYYTYFKLPYKPYEFNPEIDKTWITDTGSIVHSAIQFALFTNPKRIYLVGCDCSSGHFDNKKDGPNLEYMIAPWKSIKEFAEIYYPETEIISVNPVGLRGLFKDFYQE